MCGPQCALEATADYGSRTWPRKLVLEVRMFAVLVGRAPNLMLSVAAALVTSLAITISFACPAIKLCEADSIRESSAVLKDTRRGFKTRYTLTRVVELRVLLVIACAPGNV